MMTPVGISNLEQMGEGNYILNYKRTEGCIKYTKQFHNPIKLLKCIRNLQKSRKYSFRIYKEVY